MLWSGGKDCALACALAREAGAVVDAFVSVVDAAGRRVRFHGTRSEVLEAQARAAGAASRIIACSWSQMDGALVAALAELRADGYMGVVMGNIHLEDVRAWYETRTRSAGLEHVEPIWGMAPRQVVDRYLDRAGRALVTCTRDSNRIGAWLGRELDHELAAALAAAGADPAGEGGEYHSLAIAGPPFERPLGHRVGGRLEAEPGYAQVDVEIAAANERSP